jgi:hypothetical protein
MKTAERRLHYLRFPSSSTAVCNGPGLYEPTEQIGVHRLCASSSDADVLIAGDAAAETWVKAWTAGCELNQGRDVHWSGTDPQPLTCEGTGSCRADCKPLFEGCD